MKRETECTSARIDLCAYLQLLLLLSFARKKRRAHTKRNKDFHLNVSYSIRDRRPLFICSRSVANLLFFVHFENALLFSTSNQSYLCQRLFGNSFFFRSYFNCTHKIPIFFRSSKSFHFYALQTRQSMIFIADLFESACI